MTISCKDLISNTPNFPKEGIQFKDWSPLIRDAGGFRELIYVLDSTCPVPGYAYAGIASRGYIMASALAFKNYRGVVMVAKAGKMPPPVFHKEYDLEYGTDSIEMKKAPYNGAEIVITDDLCATGNTLVAAIQMAQEAGYKVLAVLTTIELVDLDGRKKVEDLGIPFYSVVQYEGL